MTAKTVLDTVIDNGRVELSSDAELASQGISDQSSLIVEVEFEAGEQGVDPEEAVEYALNHCSHDG